MTYVDAQQTAKALVILHVCLGLPEPSLFAYMISMVSIRASSLFFSSFPEEYATSVPSRTMTQTKFGTVVLELLLTAMEKKNPCLKTARVNPQTLDASEATMKLALSMISQT